jgi:hypothetical protein
MKMKTFVLMTVLALSASAAFAQRTNFPAKTADKDVAPGKIIFAVVDDGQRLEPIAYVESGVLVDAAGGDAQPETLKIFSQTYYKPKASYNLIFAGISAGKTIVESSNPTSDCGKNIGTITYQSAKKLKGFVMALATNVPVKATTGVRRTPTAAERAEVEKLVRAEYTKQKVPAAALKVLHYHNLTAVDVDNDGNAEMVGSYHASSNATTRDLLFFIAEKDKTGKYVFGHKDYKKYAQKDVMSGDIKDLDTGLYNETLLDVFDYKGDGSAGIFTVLSGFESNNFFVYRRENGKWVKKLESSNYHCAY